LVGNPEGKTLLGRPRRRWDDNFLINVRDAGWKVLNWIDLVEDMGFLCVLVNTAMNLRVP